MALAAVTGQATEIVRIRRRRSPPGLKAQHLAGVRLAARLCGARLEGDRIGSEELRFLPGPLQAGEFSADVGTAGSLTLLLQAALLPALLAPGPVRLRLRGGTDVRWSPPADYLSAVVLPWFRRLAPILETVPRRGYFPEGGGVLEIHAGEGPPLPRRHPIPWHALRSACGHAGPLDLLESRRPVAVRGVSSASERLRGRRVAERQADAARDVLGGMAVEIEERYEPSASPGSAMVVWAEGPDGLLTGADCLGARGLPAEEVGAGAARMLLERLERDEPVEEHLADHLVPLLALVGGRIRCQELSGHVQANLYVAERFSGLTAVRDGNVVGFD